MQDDENMKIQSIYMLCISTFFVNFKPFYSDFTPEINKKHLKKRTSQSSYYLYVLGALVCDHLINARLMINKTVGQANL